MKLQKFVNQIIRDICGAAKDANTTPPQTVEMDIAVTPTGDVCSLQTKSAGRVKFMVRMAMWPNDPKLSHADRGVAQQVR